MNYCKLYIDDIDDRTSLECLVGDGIDKFFDLKSLAFTVFDNENYITPYDVKSSTYPVDRSRYYIEIDTDFGDDPDGDKFKSGVADLVIWLRGRCKYVVVSSDFEDYIVEKTGWNWTKEQPLPPGG